MQVHDGPHSVGDCQQMAHQMEPVKALHLDDLGRLGLQPCPGGLQGVRVGAALLRLSHLLRETLISEGDLPAGSQIHQALYAQIAQSGGAGRGAQANGDFRCSFHKDSS